ncbi:MAG: endolytic transglycosylase MltG [Eubacterium sp.]|nr:endolytic transglycosylase MltG [Eubacterium sp.]
MKNKRRLKAYKTENRLRVALYYAFQLLVDAVIILIFVKGFSMSYNFSHDVFFDSAKNLKNTEYVDIIIEPDSSTKKVSAQIYDAGLVKNKYVLMAKIKVNELGSKIRPGKYSLSQSMTYNEILAIITGGASINDVQYRTEEDEKVKKTATITDADQIHDNSEEGAGSGTEGVEGGASEGDDYVPDESGDSIDSGESGETSE